MNKIDINTFNSTNIKLLKYCNNEDYYTIHLDYNSYPIKLITDFDNYCYVDSIIEIIGLDKFNLSISFKNKNIHNIIDELNKNILIDNIKIDLCDPFHIYQKIDKYDKTDINYSELYKLFINNIDIKNRNTNELLLTLEQMQKLLINEIKKINSNREYKHYITIDYTNIFSLIVNLEFDEKVQFKLIIDPYFYPIIPPKIEYIKPNIKIDLLYSINNLDILILNNWSPIINLEYLITNLANQLQPIIKDYIIQDTEYNIELKYELIKLSSLIKNNHDNKIKFHIPIPKQTKITQSANYWKSGTGYGSSTDANNGWNINKYIQEKEFEKNNILNCLIKINNLINETTISLINDQILELYIINQIKGLTILELNKNKELYNEIFNILNKLIKLGIKFNINNICDNIKIVYEEIKQLFEINKELETDNLLKIIIVTFETLIKKYNVELTKEIIISEDIKEKYCQIMKPLQFGNYEIPSFHTYIKNTGKLNQSAIIRVLSEISNFKSSLPLNWESSIWTRVSKTNFNIFSFLISGPKDTPYENGLFEFHAYFPIDYPNSVPEVVIYTTNNGKVRFNPNLYANGKVCLSLLGTWSGQESEKWNSKTSTFLQVMVSIQSLILVDQPFFNEPGWEREINTNKGKINSDKYNNELHPNTIKLGMINMIKNPPQGFEEVVKNHFTMKKDEILNKLLSWEENATNHKDIIKNYRKELIDLL